MTVHTILAESARGIAGEINDSFASTDWLGLAAIAWYFEELHAVLANRSRKEIGTPSLRIPSKTEAAASAQTVAQTAAKIPGDRLTDAHKTTEIALLQTMLDRGMPSAPALRIASAVRERVTDVITSAWLPS